MDFAKRFRVNAPDVLDESVDGEVLIVNLESGSYYSSGGTGDAIWRMIAAGASSSETVEAVIATYGAPREVVEVAVGSFTQELLAEQLLVELGCDGAAPQIPALELTSESFVVPVLQKYTDMQDLLLLDPIHDVQPTGWPEARQTKVTNG